MRERIKQIIEREGMSQSQFADFIGVNRPTLSHVLAGRNNPSLDIMMSIHRKFPQINVLWLFDGIGSYEGDARGYNPTDSQGGEQHAEQDVADSSVRCSSSLSNEGMSRFYQGELFAENPIFASESTGDAQKRKEMPLQAPLKVPYLTDTQSDFVQKKLSRKIVEIKIFYDDGTYETFRP